jgi:macrolide-specific efflux system membrane fusion protein
MKRLFTGLLCLLFTASCFVLPAEEPVLPPPVLYTVASANFRTIEVRRGDVVRYVDLTAYYLPAKEETYSFGIGDELIFAVYADLGDMVQAGDVLAELDRTFFQNELEKLEREEAWVRLNLAQLEERHNLRLSETDISGGQVDETNYLNQRNGFLTQLETMRIRREYLLHEDERRILRAGLSGTVTTALAFQEGMHSVADRIIFTIADQEQSVFVVRGPDTANMQVGQEYDLTIQWEPYLAVVADAADLDIYRSNPDETYLVLVGDEPLELGTRVFATVRLILHESTDVLFVPHTAVKKANARVFVYVMEDGVRSIRDVVIGLEGNQVTEIISGLEEGEDILQE